MAAPSQLVGQTVSHYRVLKELGSGGMGVVYEAEDIRLRRRVALKFLPEGLVSDSTALQRFEREARATSSLNHPGICTVYEVEEYQHQPVIVMELLEGKTLKERMRDGPISTEELLDFGVQLSDALSAAHVRGIIHRDLKPGNIFVVGGSRAKILDFGLAKVLPAGAEESQEESLTVDGAVPGTTPYMSPEQARGEEVDSRSDLFSLGVVLFELATGQRAFARKNRILTIDAILNARPPAPSGVNRALPAGLDAIVGKALEKDRERRYQHASEMREDLQQLREDIKSERPTDARAVRRTTYTWHSALWMASWIAILLASATAAYLYFHRAARLTEKDTIVLADFTNTTGEPVFDDTLKQGMAVQLGQSPYLVLISDERVQQTLSLMGKSPGTKLTPATAREVCERTGSTEVLEGSIAALGTAYVLGFTARNCHSGGVVHQEQVQAARKEDVLKAVNQIASRFRALAGESLSTLQQHNTPLEQATTPSLEALQAYSSAVKVSFASGFSEGIPLLKRAVEIDPSFALAHAHLGLWYSSVGESTLAIESTAKAYKLRDRASDPERFFIETMYDRHVTGNLEKARQTLGAWIQTYPRDVNAHGLLSGFCSQGTGKYEQSIEQASKALELDPDFAPGYINVAVSNFYLDHFDEAANALHRAAQRKIEVPELLLARYYIALFNDDERSMQAAAMLAKGNPEAEDWMTHSQALVLARSGRLKQAKSMSQRAIDLASQGGQRERAASYEAAVAVYSALLGNFAETKPRTNAALKLSHGRDVEYSAALALALSGYIPEASKLANDLEQRFPEDTSVRFQYTPNLRAALALTRDQPEKAIEALQPAVPYEDGVPAVDFNFFFGGLYSAYFRGQAFLLMRRGDKAAAEFQKILDHRGLVAGDPIGALAHLYVARAYALSGANARTKSEYEKFFSLWKDADSGILLKQAKEEYAKLQ
ncbi:MAG TPA: protein kinase [Terriglobales bacterium]